MKHYLFNSLKKNLNKVFVREFLIDNVLILITGNQKTGPYHGVAVDKSGDGVIITEVS